MRSTAWILLAAAVGLALPTELWGQGQGRGRGRGQAQRSADVRVGDRRDRDRDRDDDRIRGRTIVRIDDLDELDDLDDDEVLLLRSGGRTVVVGRGDIERRFTSTARAATRRPSAAAARAIPCGAVPGAWRKASDSARPAS